MKFKERPKSEKTRIIITTSIIILFVLISVLAGVIFPGSGFADIIDNSIGKFFNLFGFVQNRYVTILESIAIIIFIWILDKILIILVAILTREGKRSETIGNLMKSFVQYLMVLIAIFLILSAWGVQTLGESSVVLRVIGMVEETDKRQTARNLNRELKILFDKNNIEIPFNQLVIHQATKE